MNREKLAWTVSIVLVALLAFQIPGSLAQRDDDFTWVRTLVDIHRQVATNYVTAVDEDKLREGAIDGMLGKLDPFSVYIPPNREQAFNQLLEGSFTGVGIQLNQTDSGQVEVVTPIEDSPALHAGVMAGDIIEKVNGEAVEGVRLPDVIKKIGGPDKTEVRLTVKHLTGEVVELKMNREVVVKPVIKGYQRKPDNTWDYYVCDDPKIAYVRLTQFTPDCGQKVRDTLTMLQKDGMKGLIFDLRFNPGGRLDQAVEILDMLVDKGKTLVSTKGRNRPESVQVADGRDELPYFPMVVLINEDSASAAEIVSGSLLDNHRALVIGQRSYGKGSVQEVIPLDGKSGELKLTVAYYYLPSGRLVHKKKDATDWGVQPSIVVPMDADQERKVLQNEYEQELFHRPIPKTTTRSATAPATTQPTDVQLQAAINTMLGFIVFEGHREVSPVPEAPATSAAPVVQPATAPVEPETQPATTQSAPASVPSNAPASAPSATPATVP